MSEENEAPPLENEATDKQNDSNALESIASQDNKTTEIQNQDESNEATGNQEIENSKIKEQLQDIIKEIDDQDKGEQDKEEQGKTEQSTREQDKEEPVEEGQDKGKQNMGDQDREEQDNGEQDSKDKKEQNCQVNGQQDSQDKGEEKSQDKQEQNSQDKGEQKFQDEQEQDSQDKGEQSKDEQKQDSQVTGDQNSQDRSEQNSQDQDSKSQNGMTTDQEQVYHTWQPKGKYDVAKTEVTYEDVVPITVEDVKDPPPVEANTAANEGADQDQTGDARTNASQGLERIGPITVPQLLPNGELGSPIEIPEGIPLLARILPKEEDSNREKIPLERLFTPATDSGEITPRKKKAFASSDFYAADHPTIDDQLELAQRISGSLLDQCNKTSRGQAMYERRKEKSAKWIHQEGLKVAQSEQVKFQAQQTSSDGIETSSSSCSSQSKSKSALKLVMNPRGVQDHTTVEHHYQQLMQDSAHTMTSSQLAAGGGPASAPHLLPQMPPSPEIAKDIITDMQSPTGKGAALFAKRKKRMDKFIVDETNVQKTSAYQQEQQSIVSSNVSTEKLSTCTSSSFTQFNSSSSTSSIASSSSTVQQSNKKKSVQERDKEQKEIMQEFLKNRESQFKLVKSPWDSVLETGNTSAAFKLNQQQQAANFQQSSVPSWLEMPKPVPVNASALPTAVVAQAPPTVFSSPAPLAPGATLPGSLPPSSTFLPDPSQILTSSSPAKAKSLTPQPRTQTNTKPSLHVDTKIASMVNNQNPITIQSSVDNISTSVTGRTGAKYPEKRLSTIPNTAKYPMPSYINIANKSQAFRTTGGFVRSASASSVPSILNNISPNTLSVSNRNSIFLDGNDVNLEACPFLKPGTPPILVNPGTETQHSQEVCGTGASSSEPAIENYSSGKENGISTTFGAFVDRKNFNSYDASSSFVKNSPKLPNKSSQRSFDDFALNYDHPKSEAALKTPHGPFDASTSAMKFSSDSAFSSNSVFPNQKQPQFSSSVANYNSAFSSVSSVANDNLLVKNPSEITNNSLTKPAFGKLSEHGVDITKVSLKNKMSFEPLKSSLAVPVVGKKENVFKTIQKMEARNMQTELQFAKEIDMTHHDHITNFASSYMMSPKVDKMVHKFTFNDPDNEIKIILDDENSQLSDGEVENFVSEIQRSFSATPVALESISVNDLQPPEYFSSVSQQPESEENFELDGDFEEHEMVVSKTYDREVKSEKCTVSKSKLLTRDSRCPEALKQKALSNLEMLSTLSALSKAQDQLSNSRNPRVADVQQREMHTASDEILRSEKFASCETSTTVSGLMAKSFTANVTVQSESDAVENIHSITEVEAHEASEKVIFQENIKQLEDTDTVTDSKLTCSEDSREPNCPLKTPSSTETEKLETDLISRTVTGDDDVDDIHDSYNVSEFHKTGNTYEPTSETAIPSAAELDNTVNEENDFSVLHQQKTRSDDSKSFDSEAMESANAHINEILDKETSTNNPDEKSFLENNTVTGTDITVSEIIVEDLGCSKVDEFVHDVDEKSESTSSLALTPPRKQNSTPASTDGNPPPQNQPVPAALVYSAQVKLVQSTTSSQPETPVNAAPAPFSAPTAPAVVAPKVVAAPSSAPSFVPRKAVVVPSDDRRMSGVNFNVAASGWGTYNDYYRPTTLA